MYACLQERFHDFLPALSKWSGTVVGLTLIAIGLIGIYETYFEGGHHGEEEEAAELKLAVAGEGLERGRVPGSAHPAAVVSTSSRMSSGQLAGLPWLSITVNSSRHMTRTMLLSLWCLNLHLLQACLPS